MNKTISINISGQNFLIEENAHFILQSYLDEIRKHCGANADVQEVMNDIESGIAEKLKSSITQYKEVITIKDVESLIKVMGTAEDFDREIGETSEKNEGKTKIKRKLYRDTDNAVVAGVCSGLANYFDIDPVIFRVLFFVSIFLSGFGVVFGVFSHASILASVFGVFAYIVLCIAMPEAKTAHQKLEMCGEAPTVAAFEKLSKISQKRWKDSSGFMKVLRAPFVVINAIFKAIKNFILKIWPAIKFLFGLGLVVFSLMALAGVGIGSLYLLLQTQTNYLINFVPISEIVKAIPFTLLVIGGFFSLAIPTALLLFGGLTIIRKKNILTFNVVAILIAVWMIIGISCCAFSLRYIPDVISKINNYPTLQTATKEIDISDATKLITDGQDLSIEVATEPTEKAILSGRQVDLDAIDVKNENSELSFSKIESKKSLCIECNHHPVKLIISGDKFTEIKSENRATINIKNNLKNTPSFTLDHSSAVYWQDAKISKLVLVGSNNATVNISGTIDNADLTVNNSDINLEGLSGQTVKTTLNGNNSTIRLSGKIDNLYVNDSSINSIEKENTLNLSDLQATKMTIEMAGEMTVIAGKIGEINSVNPTSVSLIYDGSAKLTGDTTGFKILKYEEVDQLKFTQERDKLESNSEEDNQKNEEFTELGEKYFILNRGKLSESDFENLSGIFRNN
jgi:phage shock protein PspC (stress-responsive transcriptional regulator)